MKITLRKEANSETEVIIVYSKMDDNIKELVKKIQDIDRVLPVKDNAKHLLLHISDIYYIETLERKTFIYTKDSVYRSKEKFSTLCCELEKHNFVLVNRSCLLNINVLASITTMHNSKLEGTLYNGEKINISRTYMKEIKKFFG